MNKFALVLTAITGMSYSFAAFAQDVPRPSDAQLNELKSIDYSPYPQHYLSRW